MREAPPAPTPPPRGAETRRPTPLPLGNRFHQAAKSWFSYLTPALLVALLSLGTYVALNLAGRMDGVHERMDTVVHKVSGIEVLAERIEHLRDDLDEIKQELKRRSARGEIPIKDAMWGPDL